MTDPLEAFGHISRKKRKKGEGLLDKPICKQCNRIIVDKPYGFADGREEHGPFCTPECMDEYVAEHGAGYEDLK